MESGSASGAQIRNVKIEIWETASDLNSDMISHLNSKVASTVASVELCALF